MRAFITVMIFSLAAWSLSAAAVIRPPVWAEAGSRQYCIVDNSDCRIVGPDYPGTVGEYNIRIKDGDVLMKPRSRSHPRVRITADYRLYVDGRLVETTDEQKELLKDFHGLTFQIHREACEIGMEGAKIGVAGAKIGVDAITGLFKLLSPHYDSDDLEREMEQKAAKIEASAEKLEIKAEKIEKMADELETLEAKLRRQIPEMEGSERF